MSYVRGPDRLSLLPDDILDHVLSFVPNTEEKARTSLLSKRFQHLWLHHPSIVLGSALENPCFSDDSDTENAAAIPRYLHAVEACLSSAFRLSTLRTLELTLLSGHPNCNRSVDRWIGFAAERYVRSLRLLSLNGRKIPRTIFSCRTLTSLHLDCYAQHFPGSASACFPFLVDLYLSCDFSDKTLALFLSKCPALRTLTLHNCLSLRALGLSSETLSKVKIRSCDYLKSVTLDIPNLASISFLGRVDLLRVKDARRLVRASIREEYEEKPATTSPLKLSALIEDVGYVSRRLKVTGWIFDALLPEGPNDVFANLKELCCQIKCLTAPRLSSLVSMLRRCPNLEKLDLDLCLDKRHYYLSSRRINDYFNTRKEKSEQCLVRLKDFERVIKKLTKEVKEDQKREVWDQSKAVEGLEDVRSSLKLVVLRKFLGTANEMKMIEYLLGTESALETLVIDDSLMRDEKEILNLLAHMPRVSPHVQILKKI